MSLLLVERASLAARADELIAMATAWLQSRLGPALEEAVSIVMSGSHARGEMAPVSDLDYCVIFDCTHSAFAELDPAHIVQQLQEHVQSSEGPLAARFSVFWSCVRDLGGDSCHAGRFPPYDRGLLREHGRLLAGREVLLTSIPSPSWQNIASDGVRFLLTEIRPKLASLRLFGQGRTISVAQIEQLGPVLVTKTVLMPIRLLYVLMPEAETRLFVGVETAVRACARLYEKENWWPLVEGALLWRQRFPVRESQLAHVARLLSIYGPALYRCCVERHREFARRHGMNALAAELADWSRELSST